MLDQWTLSPFDPATVSDEELAAFHLHAEQWRAERLPDDPPVPLDEFMTRIRAIPHSAKARFVMARLEDGRVVGSAGAFNPSSDDNPHVLFVDLGVNVALRRQGIGTALLRWLAQEARQRKRTLIINDTNARIPAGERFAKRIGANRGLESGRNQLVMADLDRDLVSRWLADAPTDDFDLVFTDENYAEEIMSSLVALFNEIENDVPSDDLQLEDQHTTAALLREHEGSLRATNTQRWTIYACHRQSGELAGMTEIFYHPNRPQFANQGLTGVAERFRGRRLGRWLKAAMLEKILAELPAVQFVRTGNANSNAPMLRINTELGFRPYLAETVWQVELDRVLAYLQEKQPA